MESDRRKVYVEVNVTHRPDGTARPNFIKFENDEKYEIDRVIQKLGGMAGKYAWSCYPSSRKPYKAGNVSVQSWRKD